MAREKKIDQQSVEIVSIFAVSKRYKIKPFLAAAPWNDVENRYITGQEDMSTSELNDCEVRINPNQNYPINNGDRFTLIKENGKYVKNRDWCMVEFFKQLPEVAANRLSATKQHLFYLENKEQEAVQSLSIDKLIGKAFAKLSEVTTLSDMSDMLYYFGENPKNYSSSVAEARLYAIAKTEPKKITEYFDNIDVSKQVVVIKKALRLGILKRAEQSGYIMYGNTLMGANEFDAAVFLHDEKNNVIYIPVMDEIKKNGGK